MRKGEEPGFRPGAAPDAMPRRRETIRGVDALVRHVGLTPDDARRLRRDGFISLTAAPIRGPRTAGITTVALHETAEGAKRSHGYDSSEEAIRQFGSVEDLRFFDVPGVPGARGWTGSIPGESPHGAVGNVSWVQGRCVLGLGNQGPGPFIGPLSKGAQAIYERTNGTSP